LRNLWHGLGWMRLLVDALLTDPELPGQVTARVRRPWRWMGGWMPCLVARLVARRICPHLPIGVMLTVTR
jgi:hypothetical protein